MASSDRICFEHGVKDCPYCNQPRRRQQTAETLPTQAAKVAPRLGKRFLLVAIAAGVSLAGIMIVPNLDGDALFGLICSAVVIGLGGLFIAIQIERAEKKRKAEEAYRVSLEKLKADPTNANLRQETLDLGRTVCQLTQDAKGNSLFDEVAIKNDIDAACAGGVRIQNRGIKERLADLEQLRVAGVLDEEEYQRRRQAIIDEI